MRQLVSLSNVSDVNSPRRSLSVGYIYYISVLMELSSMTGFRLASPIDETISKKTL